MKDLRLKMAVAAASTIALFAMLCVAGDYDWSEQVVLHMTQAQYDWVKDTLTKKHGSEPSEREIAHWWARHHGDMAER